jgi:hypothetical protein
MPYAHSPRGTAQEHNMQTQQHPTQQVQRDAKQSAAEKSQELALRTQPRELDLDQLRHVAGGDSTSGPYKTW